jgi:ElaB/YqjD/DUF883 family membrane-anchored ribosome-binding protein
MANETVDATSRAVEEKIDAAREVAGGDRMGRLRERAGEVADAVKARAQTLREKIQNTEWEDVQQNVKNYVRDNPGKSLAIAAGVGFAIGFLLRRKDDD